MDALPKILRAIRLDSAIYFNAEFKEPWRLTTPESRALAPVLAQEAGHVIIFHFLFEGRAYAELEEGERVDLSAGDIVTFPHGHGHALGGGRSVTPIDAVAALPRYLKRGLEPARVGGNGASCRFVCGFLVCDPQLGQAFLGGLPPVIKVNIRDDPSGQWLENSLKFSVTQAANREAGADAMLAKLSEAVFAETLRRYVRQLPEGQTGWLAGLQDPGVGRALTLLHHRSAHPWTVAELAREAGLSRTVLSERFRHFLGQSPIAYLTRWRLQLGARALTATNQSVAQIASEVGYESEAAFNRAFKREYGLPPAAYRKDKAAQRKELPAKGRERVSERAR
jgi:AraC-like DNA-binding protein